MISEEKVKALTEEKIKGTDLFIVEVKVSAGNRINIYMDRETKLNVGDCAEVSRYVENNLNREVEDFEITVSSPGLDQPLRVLKQYTKHTGRNVRVLTKEGKVLRGKLMEANDDGISLELFKENKKKNKDSLNETVNLKYTEIKETKIEITFK